MQHGRRDPRCLTADGSVLAAASLMLRMLFLGLLVWAMAPTASGQVPDSLVEQVRSSVDAADVESLLALGEGRIEVGLFGAARLFSRAQAAYVLSDFFRQHPPQRLEIGESVSTETGWFAAGDYYRLGGRSPLRVYLRLRALRDGSWVVREIVVLDAPDS